MELHGVEKGMTDSLNDQGDDGRRKEHVLKTEAVTKNDNHLGPA